MSALISGAVGCTALCGAEQCVHGDLSGELPNNPAKREAFHRRQASDHQVTASACKLGPVQTLHDSALTRDAGNWSGGDMEPVTTIIASAIALGAAAGLKPTVEQAIKDAYDGLKRLIVDRYRDKAEVVDAVE